MKAQVKWIGEELFLGVSESGHSILLVALMLDGIVSVTHSFEIIENS